MTILISAVIALIAAQPALAQRRVNRPYEMANGRAAAAAPAANVSDRGPFILASPAGGSSANIETTQTSGLGRSFLGGSRVASRGASSRAGKAFWGGAKTRRADPEEPAEEAPPGYSKPGALIRTTGQEPKFKPGDERTHTVDAGEIVMNDRKAFHVAQAPSLQQGPKDTAPPPNPRDQYYGGGATANTRAGVTSSSGSGGKIGNNNGSGNNDKDKPGDDDDAIGREKRRDKTFDDPTGFNAAF